MPRKYNNNNNLTIKLISFDKDWDLSHIPEKELQSILFSTTNEFYQTYKKDNDKNINLLIKFFDEIKFDLDKKLNDFKDKNLIKTQVINEFSKILEDNQEKALEFLKNKELGGY